MHKLIRSFPLTIITAAVIAAASLVPGKSLPRISWGDLVSLDKWVHLLIYAVLTFVMIVEWQRSRAGRLPLRSLFLLCLLSALYGVGLEALQVVMNQGRYFEVLDIIANIIGSLTGLLVGSRVIKKV